MKKNVIYWYHNLEVLNRKFKYKNSFHDIKKILNYICNDEKKRSSLSIHFCNSKKIHELNLQFRNKNSSTDVLSFPHGEIEENNLFYLGDIFINEDIIESQAREINSDPMTEIKFLVMHGILHLIGYDHKNEDDEIEMKKKQKEIFRELKIRKDIC